MYNFFFFSYDGYRWGCLILSAEKGINCKHRSSPNTTIRQNKKRGYFSYRYKLEICYWPFGIGLAIEDENLFFFLLKENKYERKKKRSWKNYNFAKTLVFFYKKK